MNQTDKVMFENILKNVKDITNRNVHGEAAVIDAEIVRSATRIYLYEKYYERKEQCTNLQ